MLIPCNSPGHELWRRLFGGKPDVLGRPLLLNGRIFQVAGVLAGPWARELQESWAWCCAGASP